MTLYLRPSRAVVELEGSRLGALNNRADPTRPLLCLMRRRRHCWRARGGVGLDLREGSGSGKISVRQIDPVEISPGEFAAMVRGVTTF